MFLALRHALCTRFLFTGISSHLYHAEGWTIDDLMTEFTKQALDAYHKGFCDSWIVFVSWNIYFYHGPPWSIPIFLSPVPLFRTLTARGSAWFGSDARETGRFYVKNFF